MRTVAVVAVILLAGCASTGPDEGPQSVTEEIHVYRFEYPGADQFVGDHHGLLFRVTNLLATNVTMHAWLDNVRGGTHGPALANDWQQADAQETNTFTLAAGQSVAYLVRAATYNESTSLARIVFETATSARPYPWIVKSGTGEHVLPGHEVRTATVGVWANGTSFYTNIQALHDDADFPRGYNAADFGSDLLPVYVYDEAATEQPGRSKDNCQFTTITGYNALLKTQGNGGTGVTWMTPQDAYTRAGNEAHSLYGEPLVFLNTVVGIARMTGPQDSLPAPTADCFDPANHTP